jgi:8-oxo-dGTP diphosphatase
MRNATICFPIRDGKILLGCKKRGFGANKINGFGGKVGENESIIEAAIRELSEESGLNAKKEQLSKAGEIEFYFPETKAKEWNQKVHVFIVEEWEGTPRESEEMTCEWFDINEVPFEKMWDTDKHWMPHVISGKKIKATFYFNEDTETTKSFNIEETSKF